MIFFFNFGLSVALFLFLLILVKRNKNNSDYVLAAWMGFMALHLTLFILDYSRVSYQYPHLLGILLPLPVLHGPFLYCYTLQITTNRFPKRKIAYLHLTPFLLLVGLAVPFYVLTPHEKLQVYLNHGKGFEWYSAVQNVQFVVVGLTYSAVSVLQIRKHRKQMLEVFSSHEKKQLLWLEWMALGLGSIWFLVAFFNDQVIFSGVVIFILFIGIFGINQTPVFFTLTPEKAKTAGTQHIPVRNLPSEKYQRNGLDEDGATRLSAILETFMRVNKPYKNPELTLDDLATLIQVNPNQLSQVINAQVGKTFYHYINSYRIKEFLCLATLPDSNKFTYLGLAYDCGFQSKTTFNKYFKLETGKTPSEHLAAVHEAGTRLINS